MLIRHREAGEKNLIIIERLFEKLLSIPRLVDVDNKQGNFRIYQSDSNIICSNDTNSQLFLTTTNVGKADEEPLFDEDDYCISDEDGEEEDESPQENKSMGML
jgi:hypothetical protein